MADLLLHPLTLRGLYLAAMAKAALRFYNPRRRASGRHQDAFYMRTWKEAGEEIGATWTVLRDDLGELELDGRRTRVVGNVSEIDGPVTLAVLHDKPLTHKLVSAEGLPVPRHATFTTKSMNVAIQFMQAIGGDCVVKPAGGTGGGRGVATGIRTKWQLVRAAAAASVYADELMIE
jgi:cyanophycin synthetase